MNPNFPRETPQKTVNVFSPEKKQQNVSKQTATQINYTKINNRSKWQEKILKLIATQKNPTQVPSNSKFPKEGS